jgi:NitT/TauT family transport system ATP-binding protein
MLDFVDTPKRLVILTPLGIRLIRAGMEVRKEIWKARLIDLKLFRVVQEQLELHEGQLTREELIAEIQLLLPMEKPELTFETLVAWGRFGELFAYWEEKGVLTSE